MNKLLRILAEQTFYTGQWEGDGVYTGQLDLEKFAQLIVQECIQLMEARKYADPNDSAEHYVNQGLATGVSLINQHFGVEQ